MCVLLALGACSSDVGLVHDYAASPSMPIQVAGPKPPTVEVRSHPTDGTRVWVREGAWFTMQTGADYLDGNRERVEQEYRRALAPCSSANVRDAQSRIRCGTRMSARSSSL